MRRCSLVVRNMSLGAGFERIWQWPISSLSAFFWVSSKQCIPQLTACGHSFPPRWTPGSISQNKLHCKLFWLCCFITVAEKEITILSILNIWQCLRNTIWESRRGHIKLGMDTNWLHFLAFVNTTATNMDLQMEFLWVNTQGWNSEVIW